MGKLITFEGIDGSGKTSVIAGVKRELEAKGKTVLSIQEPGGTEMAEKLRELIKSDTDRHQTTDLFLFLASRNDMAKRILYPALGIYDYILLDRYIDSTIAYQGYGLGYDVNYIETLHRPILRDVRIDKTIYLDVNPQEAAKRRHLRSEVVDRYEDQSFLEKVYSGYSAIIEQNPDRFVVLENDNLEETIKKATKAILTSSKTTITRETLARHQDKQLILRATFVRPGRREDEDGNEIPTVLLKNVKRKYSNQILCDHIWIDYTREVLRADTLIPGDLIEFTAETKTYQKHVRGQLVEEAGITNIEGVKVVQAVKVPKTDKTDQWGRNSLAYIYSVTNEQLFNELRIRYVKFVSAMVYKYYGGNPEV